MNCAITDKRSKEGIAIYIRNNQRVLDACLQVGSIRNMIYVTVLLRSGFFSINYGLPYANSGLYHPPKHNYQECHLLSTIFAWKTACQKYFFRIFSQTRSGGESQKSELGFDLKNPHALRVDVMDS